MAADDVLVERLANQRLTTPGPEATALVADSLAVQAQDGPFARWSLTLRGAGADADVRAAIEANRIVRTHVLRPTWHLVRDTDLTWLQGLLGARVEQGLASRHRQLGLVEGRLEGALEALAGALADGPRTRSELTAQLIEHGVSAPGSTAGVADTAIGSVVGHVLVVAELRCLIASAGLVGEHQRYRWIGRDDRGIAPPPDMADDERRDRQDELVTRFVASHGPVSARDITRWAKLTLGQVKDSIGRLGQLEPVRVNGLTLHRHVGRRLPTATVDARGVFLLPSFDEAFLTHRDVIFERATGHPCGTTPYRFAEASTGVVLHGLRDVGTWRKRRRGSTATSSVELAPGLGRAARARVDELLDDVAAHGL